MEERADKRGKRVISILQAAGQRAGLEVQLQYPVIGGRVDVVWLWRGPASFPSALPIIAFEVESSWRTRKHLKGDFLNLLDLQPSLGVIVLLGEGEDVEGTRRFAKHMVDRRGARIAVWSEKDVLALEKNPTVESARLLAEVAAPEPESQVAMSVAHSGKYRALSSWLAIQTVGRLEVQFAEIEEILAFPLPPSSRKHAAHWHSYEGSAVVRAIRDAGWKVTKLDLAKERLTLERQPAGT